MGATDAAKDQLEEQQLEEKKEGNDKNTSDTPKNGAAETVQSGPLN